MPSTVAHEPVRDRRVPAVRIVPSAWLLAVAGALGAVPVAAPAATLDVLVTDERDRPLEHAAVSVVAGPPSEAPPGTVATVGQADRRFVPAVIAVQTGTRVSFPNRDDVRHHVYSFSTPNDFRVELYDAGPDEGVRFDHAGIVTLGCNIHDTMVGHVVVVDTPLHAVTGADGRASVADVPAGTHALHAWHPDTGERVLDIDVPSGAERAARTVRLVSRPAAAQPANPLQNLFTD